MSHSPGPGLARGGKRGGGGGEGGRGWCGDGLDYGRRKKRRTRGFLIWQGERWQLSLGSPAPRPREDITDVERSAGSF